MLNIDPEIWPSLSQLLDDWLDLAAEDRSRWLEGLGPEHAAILPALRELVATQEMISARSMLEALPALRGATDEFAAGMQIGPYRLVREVGHGGMGVVWLAERFDGALKRLVALKLPLIPLYRTGLSARFARERDILAQLAHPNIARLYDAGVANDGQPYLALEYIDGEPITTYCDRQALTIKARLALFLDVLRAAQYAHANLVVHRDLKPTNILVTGQGEVRLLDFGIAKLLNGGEANETELTQQSGRALTPDYASPEQITGEPITTASDVYSLGVVLYELLTGERPYRLKRNTPGGLEEAIAAADIVRPSHAVKDGPKAHARAATAKRLARELRGDLDTIVLKALEKSPARRYLTADALAQDIERYLSGNAVLAQPASAWYSARKFVLRNKLAVASSVAVVAALGIGLGIALREAYIARVQTRTAEATESFLQDIFRANSTQNPDPVKARQTTARQLLDIGAENLDRALNDTPQAKLRVIEMLFWLYQDLGLKEQQISLGRRRIALAKTVYGPSHPEVARALTDLAANSASTAYAKDNASLLKEAGEILDRNGDFRSSIRATYYFAMADNVKMSDDAKAAEFAAKAVKLDRAQPPSSKLVGALDQLGQAQWQGRHYTEAIATYSEAAKIANSLQGSARIASPRIYTGLGYMQQQVFSLAGAEQSFRSALDVARTVRGEDHEDTIQTKYYLGMFLSQTARPTEGLKLLQESVDLAVRIKGADDGFHTPMVRRAYGSQLFQYGRVEQGLAFLELSLDASRRAQRSATRPFADSLARGGEAQTSLGRYRQASELIAEAEAIHARMKDSAESGQLTNVLLARAGLLVATGKPDEAEKILRDLPMALDGSSSFSYAWLDGSIAWADVKLAQGQVEPAIAYARAVRSRIESSDLRPYLKRYEVQAALKEGEGLMLAGRSDVALPLLERAATVGREVYDSEHSLVLAESQIALGECAARLGNIDRARALLAQAKRIHSEYASIATRYTRPVNELETRLRLRQTTAVSHR